jgi:hypothetical protein
LRRGGDGTALPAAESVDTAGGLLYVPPVDPELAPERDRLVDALRRRGVSLLVQLDPDEARSSSAVAAEAIAVDLLEALLSRRLDALDAVPPGAVVVWPLLPALTDDPALWAEGCRRLAAGGAACVQAMVPELSPSDRRRLASGDGEPEIFSRVFHGRAEGERRFAATAASHGLEVFFRRRSGGGDRRSRNEALAELLALGAELWLRLGRGEVLGQELFRASRWVEDTAVDVRALAAEGNLEIVEALREPAAEIVGEWGRTGASATVDRWLAEYVGASDSR